MQFFYVNIVDGCYIVNFDNMIFVVVNDNPWWHWLLPENANCALDYFH